MTELKVPAVAESITEVTLARYIVKDGEYVELDQPVCELETDKASQEIPSPVAGVVKFVAKEGDDLKVGAVICLIDESAAKKELAVGSGSRQEEKKAIEKKTEVVVQSAITNPKSEIIVHASPIAKKILEENFIDASHVIGTGAAGKITKEDALKAVKAKSEKPKAEAFSRNERREKMSRLRKTISERLVYSKNSTAMLTTFNEVDMSAVNKIREQFGESFKAKHGVSLGMMSFFSKAVCLSFKTFQAVNASIEENEIVYHDFVDISIAVSTPKGLVVPVIRNAESLSLAGIEKKVKELAIKGRDGKLTMDEMTGGTFTISNGGVFGSLMSTPIINPPQVAILGLHKIQDRPVVIDGALHIRPMMYLALSYDHRVIDGKESVSFLVSVKDFLESPWKMLSNNETVESLLEL